MNLKKWRSLILILVLSLLFSNLEAPAFAEEAGIPNHGAGEEANAVNAAIVAYRDIVRRYHEAWYPQLLESYKSFSPSPDINEERFREWYFSNCYYVLYDIDGDGIPELVVQHGDTQANIKPGFTVYTFDAQSMLPVNLGECLTQDKFVSTEFAFSDETERVFVELADYRESTSVKRIHLKNGVLTEEPYYLIPSREAYDIFNKNCLTSYAFNDESGLFPRAADALSDERTGSLTPEQLSAYRQFLLRGDLLKDSKLTIDGRVPDVSEFRYRFCDIDMDGTAELYLVMPYAEGSDSCLAGRLWLDQNGQVNQEIWESSNVVLGSVVNNGKTLEALYMSSSLSNFWTLYDPDSLRDHDIRMQVGCFGYDYPNAKYSATGTYGELITEEEYPKFIQQVDLIVAGGQGFDSLFHTISYEELIGEEALDPDITEVTVDIDWKQNTQFPEERTLTLTFDGTLQTMPFAENAIIYTYYDSFDVGNAVYRASVTDKPLDYIFARRTAIIQMKNDEIIAVWNAPSSV